MVLSPCPASRISPPPVRVVKASRTRVAAPAPPDVPSNSIVPEFIIVPPTSMVAPAPIRMMTALPHPPSALADVECSRKQRQRRVRSQLDALHIFVRDRGDGEG